MDLSGVWIIWSILNTRLTAEKCDLEVFVYLFISTDSVANLDKMQTKIPTFGEMDLKTLEEVSSC